jgi:hypothetical protein
MRLAIVSVLIWIIGFNSPARFGIRGERASPCGSRGVLLAFDEEAQGSHLGNKEPVIRVWH